MARRSPIFPEYKNVHQIALRPDDGLPSPLFTVVGHRGQVAEYTQSDLREGSLRWGAELARRIRPGDRVMLCMPTSPDFLHAFFGTLMAGGVAVPVPYAFHRQAEYLEEYLTTRAGVVDDCQAVVLATHPDNREVSEQLAQRCPSLAHVVTAGDLRDPEPGYRPFDASADDLALLQYTSGSTGEPKGVVLSHGCLLWNLRAIGEGLQPETEGEAVVSWLPLYHDMGLIGGWLWPLGSGLRHVLMATEVFLTEPSFWLQAMTQVKATITVAPNFGYALAARRVKDAMVKMFDLSRFRTALCGAEPVDAAAMAAFQAKFAPAGCQPHVMMPVYGLAEATLAVTFTPILGPIKTHTLDRKRLESEGLAVDADASDPTALKVVSVGRPLRDGQVKIVDQHGDSLPERRQGQVLVRSGSVMKGYWNRAELTERTLADGWLHTGDLGYLDGGELYVTGRIKDMIITYGRNFYPHDIEWLTARVKGVRTGCVAAFGVHNEEASTEEIVLLAETRETEKEALQAIRREIRRLLITTIECNPKHILLLPPRAVPKTTSGKVRRAEARNLFLENRFERLL